MTDCFEVTAYHWSCAGEYWPERSNYCKLQPHEFLNTNLSNISQILIFADWYWPRNSTKIWQHENFLLYSIWEESSSLMCTTGSFLEQTFNFLICNFSEAQTHMATAVHGCCVGVLGPFGLQHFSGHFGRVQLTYLHCSWASLIGSLPVLSAHSFASNWRLPFLNQRKGENGCRNYFIINLHERMLPDMRIIPAPGSSTQCTYREN